MSGNIFAEGLVRVPSVPHDAEYLMDSAEGRVGIGSGFRGGFVLQCHSYISTAVTRTLQSDAAAANAPFVLCV